MNLLGATSHKGKASEGARYSLRETGASKIVTKEIQRRKAREGMSRYRKAMTKEKKEKFRKENRERMKQYRASMSEQQKKKCSEVMKKWRARLTDEQRQLVRERDRKRKKKRRDEQSKKLCEELPMNRSHNEEDESLWDGLWNDTEIII
mmetsp:Transcript_24332/g.57265  ORF Transcript_24332/g.57265 Transcript_24332/m.57265 type:complete len:149 (+) Transcript_24332:172-618(+)